MGIKDPRNIDRFLQDFDNLEKLEETKWNQAP